MLDRESASAAEREVNECENAEKTSRSSIVSAVTKVNNSFMDSGLSANNAAGHDIFASTVTSYPSTRDVSTWSAIIVQALPYLELHEAIQLRSVSSFVDSVLSKKQVKFCFAREIVLSVPWNRCAPSKRRKWFSLIYQLTSLRIEPVFASVMVAEDLFVLLLNSAATLQRLCICSPCAPLLLDVVTASYPSDHEGDYRNSGSFPSPSDLPNSVFVRCQKQCGEKAPFFGCSYFDHSLTPLQTKHLPALTALSHLELSGNDAHLWCLTFSAWKLPVLCYLTVQTWTTDTASAQKEDHRVEENDAAYVKLPSIQQSEYSWTNATTSARSSLDLLMVAGHDTTAVSDVAYDWDVSVVSDAVPKCCVLRKNRQGKSYLQRTIGCIQRGISGVVQLLHNVQSTVKELELIVPGRPTAAQTSLILSLAGTSEALDPEMELDTHNWEEMSPHQYAQSDSLSANEYWDNGLTEQADEYFEDESSVSETSPGLTSHRAQVAGDQLKTQSKNYYQFICSQFTGFVQILRTVLFYQDGMHKLEKLRFLGLVGFHSGIHALMTALTHEYNASVKADQEINRPPRSTSQGDPKNALPPCFATEPGQPVLPLLNFEDDCDAMFMKSNEAKGVAEQPNTSLQCQPEKRSVIPLGRCLIIFSGVLHFPQRSCLELTVLYPDCVRKENAILFASRSDDARTTRPQETTHCRRSTFPETAHLEPVILASQQNGQSRHRIVMKVRLQQESPADPEREFQRLQTLTRQARNLFLQPAVPRKSAKGKPPSRKKQILVPRDAPQDVSILLKECSSAITTIEIFLGDHSSSIRPFAAMPLTSLEWIRIVNWNGGNNRSHITLFSLTYCRPFRPVRLTIETTDDHYERTRRQKPKGFYQYLIRFVKLLRSRGIMVDRLSLFPGPEAELVPFAAYIFPIYRLHLTPAPLAFYEHLARFQVPTSLITFFLTVPSLPELQPLTLDQNISSSGLQDGEEDACRQPSSPVVFTINSKAAEVSAPLERGYTHIREFLVQATERQRVLGQDVLGRNPVSALPFVGGPDSIKKPASSSATVPALETEEDTTVLINELVETLPKGAFYNDPKWRSLITISCTSGQLAEFYKTVLALKTFSISKLSEDPFRALHGIMKFDVARYGMLNTTATESPLWAAETILLPWLTIAYGFVTLTYFALALIDVPIKSQRAEHVFQSLQNCGKGFTFAWLPKRAGTKDNVQDVLLFVLSPTAWSPALCDWALQYARGKVPEAMVMLLTERQTSESLS